MKRFLPIVLAAASVGALASAPAAAQVQQPPLTVEPGHSILTVNGEGRSFREPDTAVFSAGVTTQGKTAGEALAENSRAMTGVIAALKRAGIADRDIQTSNLSIFPVYRDPNQEAMLAARAGQPYVPPVVPAVPEIVGYQANNSVSVRQRKLGDYGKVIDTLASAGANQINGPMFQMDDPEPATNEARVAAIKQARERAELYASAAGLRIHRILAINEGGSYYGPPPVMFARVASVGAPPPPPPPPPSPVQAGELQLTASVSVMYELAP